MFQPKFTAAELHVIARAVYTGPVYSERESRAEYRVRVAEHWADILAPTNPLFDRERFLRAATTGENRR